MTFTGRAARHDSGAHVRKIGLVKVLVSEHGNKHRRHAVYRRDFLAVDGIERALGENANIGTMVDPWVMHAVIASTMPKQWNIGT